ncbi:hypothetical protein MAIT1_01358 [Magnetofaba australis IT-1]|uniref:DUF3095 domain-containing protein n=1 Tax=Magnetofaba australis IT-1 TaxID=1434232 RepID=A0A1Y2K0C4_9PROT|nr:hypothetical protein MAIT1_01358 [Magnetofaba australis IT-1]
MRGSTQAIERGLYREVNMAGALSIIALLNLAESRDLPFVFGGDGATVLIPPELAESAKPVLAATAALVDRVYQLQLRVGLVPIADVLAAGQTLRMARVAVAHGYHQAIFHGDGMGYAEALVKDAARGAAYRIDPQENYDIIDHSGLECRWRDVPSPREETVSLLIQTHAESTEAAMALYGQTLDRIAAIYGDEQSRHPISLSGLTLSFSPHHLRHEARLLLNDAAPLKVWLQGIKLAAINLLGVLLMDGLTGAQSPWRLYKRRLLETCDCQKFDGMLRMVLAGTSRQRAQLTSYLEQQRRAGQLIYGAHWSDRALMTCLIFQRHGRHVHFVDGADGGYAMAAKQFKAQLAALGTV